MTRQIKFIQGNEACVEGALYAGLDFFAGYPITPSTEIAEHLSVRLPQQGGKFIQMEDEIASMCAIIGASLTGHKVLTATSGPGFSLKQEALGDEQTEGEARDRLCALTVELVDHIRQEIAMVGFWQRAQARDGLRSWIFMTLDDADLLLDSLLDFPFQRFGM